MCRIASIFLLQRLKGSMSGDARDFTNIETRAVIKKHPPLQGKVLKEIHAILTETLGEHAPSYATAKNWVAQIKRSYFSTCDVPRPGRPKTMTTPEIIDQIHELNLEDRRISAKSIAEQLGISRERVGSTIHEDLTCGSSPRSGSRNAWTRIKNVNGASRLSNFWNFFGAIQMISRRDWWPWTKPGYISMTRRQSNNQWSGGIAAHPNPKYSECKNPLEKFSPRFLGIKTASSSFIIFQRAKLSTQSFTLLCWCIWRIFWRKNAAGRSPRESCSYTTMPRFTGHLQPRRNWFTCLYVFITQPYSPDLAPSDYHLFRGLKKQLEGRHFSSMRRSLLSPGPGWTDKIMIFFWVACRS